MLKKLLCWLLGHNYYCLFLTGTVQLTNDLTGQVEARPTYKKVEMPRCQRCDGPNPNAQAKDGYEMYVARYPYPVSRN